VNFGNENIENKIEGNEISNRTGIKTINLFFCAESRMGQNNLGYIIPSYFNTLMKTITTAQVKYESGFGFHYFPCSTV
jgi:hypothetical protein